MPLGSTELGREKCLDEIPGHRRPYGPTSHADDVDVVVFHSLTGREVIVDKRCPSSRHLVGADRRADAAAADRYAAIHLSRGNSLR